MAKTFTYGGYTFEPRGLFKDFGIKADRNEFYNITKALHYPRFPENDKVADGNEPYDYKAFYEAAGKQTEDVFFCHETGELYVPCAGALAVFDKKHSGEEVKRRCNRRIAEREERERERKREALKDVMYFTEEQHQAFIRLRNAVKECREMGMQLTCDDGDLMAFRTDLLKDITTNMVPTEGQTEVDSHSLYQVTSSIYNSHDGLYANIRE